MSKRDKVIEAARMEMHDCEWFEDCPACRGCNGCGFVNLCTALIALDADDDAVVVEWTNLGALNDPETGEQVAAVMPKWRERLWHDPGTRLRIEKVNP